MAEPGHVHPPPQDERNPVGGILPGFSLSPEQQTRLHAKLGRNLPPEVYRGHMTGHRILIAPRPVDEMWGDLLYKPASVQSIEQLQMGAGWIVSVGPFAGTIDGSVRDAPHPVGIVCDHPRDLLGLEVIYQMYTGMVLRTAQEDEFGGQHSLVVLTDRDIMQVGGEGL